MAEISPNYPFKVKKKFAPLISQRVAAVRFPTRDVFIHAKLLAARPCSLGCSFRCLELHPEIGCACDPSAALQSPLTGQGALGGRAFGGSGGWRETFASWESKLVWKLLEFPSPSKEQRETPPKTIHYVFPQLRAKTTPKQKQNQSQSDLPRPATHYFLTL